MSLPDVVSREQWLAARKELLAKEKELTRVRDALNAERRMLPMVEIDKPYVFGERAGINLRHQNPTLFFEAQRLFARGREVLDGDPKFGRRGFALLRLAGSGSFEALAFGDLKGILGATDGNLSVHARKLEDAGYVTCTKTFDGRRPRTEYRLAPRGRQALTRYLNHMEALIRATRGTLGR